MTKKTNMMYYKYMYGKCYHVFVAHEQETSWYENQVYIFSKYITFEKQTWTFLLLANILILLQMSVIISNCCSGTSWPLTSSATQLFVQHIIQVNNKENIKAPYPWHRAILFTRGQ